MKRSVYMLITCQRSVKVVRGFMPILLKTFARPRLYPSQRLHAIVTYWSQHTLPAWSAYLSGKLSEQINSSFKRTYDYILLYIA